MVRAAVPLGVRKVRLTGGEPLVRRNLETLVGMLAPIPGVDDLTLTTNASLLASKAQSLADAGLRRVTVSLDALDDPTFQAMNDVGFPVARVLDGLAAAEAAGLGPIKVNTVIRRGVNEHAVLDLAERFRGTGTTVRFIEFMDVGHTNGWRLDDVVPAAEIVARIDARWPLEPIDADYRGEVAGAGGTVTVPARSASSPASRSRSAATAPAPASPPTAASTPACSARAATTSARCCAAAPPMPTSPKRCAASGSAATTATPSCAASRRSTCRRSR